MLAFSIVKTQFLSQVVRDQALGHVFPHGDPVALADLLVRLSAGRDELRQLGQRGKEYVLTHYTYRTTTEPLRGWVAEPQPAPDRGHRVPLEAPAQPSPIALAPGEIRHYYRAAGLTGVLGRLRDFLPNRLDRGRPAARLEPTHYLASFRDHDVPDRTRPGERLTVHVTVVNQGART